MLYERVIPPEYEDFNGHMSITHYLGIHHEAGLPFYSTLGIDDTYISRHHLGLVDLENHLRYLAEVYVGDRVAVHARLLGRSDKAMHGVWFLVNLTREQLSNTLEFVVLHVDLDLRRATPFPTDLAKAIDRLIAEGQTLTWDPPVCGFMGVAQPAP